MDQLIEHSDTSARLSVGRTVKLEIYGAEIVKNLWKLANMDGNKWLEYFTWQIVFLPPHRPSLLYTQHNKTYIAP